MEARNILSRFSILLVVLFSTNCSKDIADDQVSGIVDIQKIEPEEGKATTEVTLTGTYFETDINKVSLFFNNTEAVITSLTETTLKTTVPRGAETGTIKIVIDGEETLGPEFTYIITPAQVITVAGLEIAGDIIGPIAESSFKF